jgi:hypothetical protein
MAALVAGTAFGMGPTNRDRSTQEPAPRMEAPRPAQNNRVETSRDDNNRNENTRTQNGRNQDTQNQNTRSTFQRETVQPPKLVSQPRQEEQRVDPVVNRPVQPVTSRPSDPSPRNDAFARGDQPTHHKVEVLGPKVPQRQSWGGNWRDENRSSVHVSFNFGLYLFNPYDQPSYVSPWYDYSELPPYIPASTVTVINGYRCQWNQGTLYSLNGSDSGLNQSADSIADAFLNRDTTAIDGMIPTSSQVAIFTDGNYAYSLPGGDFQQMIADNVNDVNTVSFKVTSTDRFNGGAIVHATHVVQTADGGQETVYQTYRLRAESGDHYVVTDFMTSQG